MDAEETLAAGLLPALWRTRSGAAWLMALLVFLLFALPTQAAGDQHLADGALGKPGLRLWGYRSDITFDNSDPRGADGPEFSSGRAEVLIPLSRSVSLFARYRAENRLNILHQGQLGLRLRFLQPNDSVSASEEINPDGPLGYPYLSLSGGLRLYENETDARFGIVGLEITYPWTHHITVSAGAELNTDTSVTIVDKFFGSLSVYTARYLSEEPFANPDGPVGYLSLRLSGGGSGEGFFGQLDILFPLTDQVTIGGFVRGERVAFPYERSATLGVRFQLYPGVIR